MVCYPLHIFRVLHDDTNGYFIDYGYMVVACFYGYCFHYDSFACTHVLSLEYCTISWLIWMEETNLFHFWIGHHGFVSGAPLILHTFHLWISLLVGFFYLSLEEHPSFWDLFGIEMASWHYVCIVLGECFSCTCISTLIYPYQCLYVNDVSWFVLVFLSCRNNFHFKHSKRSSILLFYGLF